MMLATAAFAADAFRPPAAPLVTHSPYFSIWQMSDRLTDEWAKHWTGAPHAMFGMVRVDGRAYRFMGPAQDGVHAEVMEQKSLRITPTRTIVDFEGAGIKLAVTFCSPLLPNDIDILARPITYVTFAVTSADATPRDAQVYFDLCAEVAVHDPNQAVQGSGGATPRGGINLKVGTVDQPTLKRRGDGVRIDWGWAHVFTTSHQGGGCEIGEARALRAKFAEGKDLNGKSDLAARRVNDGWPVIATQHRFATVKDKRQHQRLLLAYDEDYAVTYLGQQLRPYWRKNHASMEELLIAAMNEADEVHEKCRKFDESLMSDLTEAGGEKYAMLCALAHRQAIAACGLALAPGNRPFMFSKENSSNGCIGTVDVFYPAAPQYLLMSPTLMEANLAPVIEYAATDRWKFNFAPHDVGTYPRADGQVYGGGEKTEKDQMPVEESANMLILVAALERATGKPSNMAKNHLPLLEKWANYLLDKGMDPENQLCTDDFTGHLAHNVNLSAKAIVGIASFGQICTNHGHGETAKRYLDAARDMAKKWVTMATESDHTLLAFDKPGTWSQKYNLVWDKVLGLNLFPQEVLDREIAYYRAKSNKFGPPLDNRAAFAKLDWTTWSACLAKNQGDFTALVDPLYDFASESPDRVPLSDWYFTDSGKFQAFKARPVVGGVFMKMLCDEAMWKKWARGEN